MPNAKPKGMRATAIESALLRSSRRSLASSAALAEPSSGAADVAGVGWFPGWFSEFSGFDIRPITVPAHGVSYPQIVDAAL